MNRSLIYLCIIMILIGFIMMIISVIGYGFASSKLHEADEDFHDAAYSTGDLDKAEESHEEKIDAESSVRFWTAMKGFSQLFVYIGLFFAFLSFVWSRGEGYFPPYQQQQPRRY